MCRCVRGDVLGVFLLLGLSGMVGVLKVADLLFVVLVWLGVCSFFAKWLFGLCFIHVVCVLCVVVVDVFLGDCVYI